MSISCFLDLTLLEFMYVCFCFNLMNSTCCVNRQSVGLMYTQLVVGYLPTHLYLVSRVT